MEGGPWGRHRTKPRQDGAKVMTAVVSEWKKPKELG